MFELPTDPWTLSGFSAGSNRDLLVRFWLAAPQDMLASLWSSPVGESTKQLVLQLDPEYAFSPDQISLRNAIGRRLQDGFQAPMSIQLLIANFLLSPPGLLRINNPQGNLPDWLLSDYQMLYEGLPSISAQEAANPALGSSQNQPSPQTNVPQPDFGAFPSTLQELVGNRIQLNRLLGLYYIDPDDREILQELRQVRLSLIEAIERCQESELEKLWSTDLGDRYWALVRSGIQKESLTPAEERKKQEIVDKLNTSSGGGFGTPGAVNAFLIAMVLFEPGTMRVDDADRKLPAWLLPHYQQVCADSLTARQS